MKKKRQKSNFIEIFEEKVNSVNVIYKKHVISIQHQECLKFSTTQIGKKIYMFLIMFKYVLTSYLHHACFQEKILKKQTFNQLFIQASIFAVHLMYLPRHQTKPLIQSCWHKSLFKIWWKQVVFINNYEYTLQA